MKFLDIIMPQNCRCIFCGRECELNGVCDNCLAHLPIITGNTCEKCGTNISSGRVCDECKNNNYKFERVFSILEYSGAVRKAIVRLKTGGAKSIAYPLSEIVDDYFEKLDIPFDVIIPMPIHKNRLKERGFNQCELLLEKVKEHYGRVYTDVVIRDIDTPHQTGLTRENRKSNLKNAFKVVNKNKIKGKTVLIFDDIYTTGTSMNECAKTCLKAGASVVYGLCLARTPIKLDKYLESVDDENFSYVI